MAIKTEQKLDAALADYAAGKSLRECEKLHGVNYRTLQRAAKKRSVGKGSLSQLITNKAAADAASIEIEEALSQLPAEMRKVVEKEAEQRQKHLDFFNDAAILNVKQAMAYSCAGQADYKARSETISRARENVLGKTPDVSVQINNVIRLEDLLADI